MALLASTLCIDNRCDRKLRTRPRSRRPRPSKRTLISAAARGRLGLSYASAEEEFYSSDVAAVVRRKEESRLGNASDWLTRPRGTIARRRGASQEPLRPTFAQSSGVPARPHAGRATLRRAWRRQNATAVAYKELTFSLARGAVSKNGFEEPLISAGDNTIFFGAAKGFEPSTPTLARFRLGIHTRMYAALSRIALSPSAACLCRPTLSVPRHDCRPSSEDFRKARTKAIVPRSDCLWKPMAPSMSRRRRHNTPETETSSTGASRLVKSTNAPSDPRLIELVKMLARQAARDYVEQARREAERRRD